jgi:hypothetical protein
MSALHSINNFLERLILCDKELPDGALMGLPISRHGSSGTADTAARLDEIANCKAIVKDYRFEGSPIYILNSPTRR